jgi:O-antigen/teichoic acid export membrane protein
VWVNIFAALLNVGLTLLLVQRFAAVGVAAASLAVLVVQNVINQWALRGAIGTAFIDRSCVGLYLVILASSAALWTFQELVHPGLVIGVLAAALAWIVVLLVGRRAIQLGDTFPELRRIPVLERLFR